MFSLYTSLLVFCRHRHDATICQLLHIIYWRRKQQEQIRCIHPKWTLCEKTKKLREKWKAASRNYWKEKKANWPVQTGWSAEMSGVSPQKSSSIFFILEVERSGPESTRFCFNQSELLLFMMCSTIHNKVFLKWIVVILPHFCCLNILHGLSQSMYFLFEFIWRVVPYTSGASVWVSAWLYLCRACVLSSWSFLWLLFEV